jgi:hypothetical protein
MPFFLILPLWLLCLVIGGVLCIFKRVRFLSLYVILCSTGGTLVSFILSTLVLVVMPRLLPNMAGSGLLVVGMYLLGIGFGGLIGVTAGLFAARKANQWLRWA